MKKILIVEDDSTLNETLAFNLKKIGYLVHSAHSVVEAKNFLKSYRYNIIILDVSLPDGSGFTLCKFIKNTYFNNYAVIFLTANDAEKDMLRGYDFGADDYITKPFSLVVLEKKINVFAKRTSNPSSSTIYMDSHIMLNFESLSASIDQNPVDFTPMEFKLLEMLTRNEGRILRRESILEELWDCRGNYADESSLNSIICRIRSKIDTDSLHYIKTVYGTGYMWMMRNHYD
ncbi:response regulator transcription factor [Blautia coccoides]|uniref:response regulator transcription factor n=1 Tax=Blautia producta TaxID=33035 RepID=UPI0028A55DBA|nr:response regulator transcription factor [Blautia coccoides]MDT4375179.1 response regulator transcription factor [Blautia coccoides]